MKTPLDDLLRACRAHRGGNPDAALREATGEFLQAAGGDLALAERAAASLRDLPPHGAAWMAVALGALIERGKGVEVTGPLVLDAFLRWLPKLPVVPSDAVLQAELPAPAGEQQELLDAFPQLCQSVVAHLARMPAIRAALAQDGALLERLGDLESYSYGASWVREALCRASGHLVVLHPPSARGLKVRYENVAMCFHLFSLLQVAIGERLPGGRAPDPAVVAAAHGQAQQVVTDQAWWHYGHAYSPRADIGASIWGEELVSAIPVVKGVQVIVLWPPLLGSRSWDSNFFGPHLDALPSDVIVEGELLPEEAQAWFQALGIAIPRHGEA